MVYSVSEHYYYIFVPLYFVVCGLLKKIIKPNTYIQIIYEFVATEKKCGTKVKTAIERWGSLTSPGFFGGQPTVNSACNWLIKVRPENECLTIPQQEK